MANHVEGQNPDESLPEPKSENKIFLTENSVETRLHNKLIELKKDIAPAGKHDPLIRTDSPFSRMLYSIPIFILFWAFYWFTFSRE